VVRGNFGYQGGFTEHWQGLELQQVRRPDELAMLQFIATPMTISLINCIRQ
jgi:hypothetical protein